MSRLARTLVACLSPLSLLSLPSRAKAQDSFHNSDRLSIVFGLSQLALGGGNVELAYHTKRMVFAWSHGFSLEFDGAARSKEWVEQGIRARMPWTTGFGVGLRATENLDLRLEVKRHAFEVFPEGAAAQPITLYQTTTVGIGSYYRWYPFGSSAGVARGLVVVPSVRYWPSVGSTLPGDSIRFVHPVTGQTIVHRAAEQGIPGTGGLFANVSVGYTLRPERR